MTVPVALETEAWVVVSLCLKELQELRVAGLHLVPGGPSMVGEEEAPPMLYYAVDDPTEVVPGFLDALLRV